MFSDKNSIRNHTFGKMPRTCIIRPLHLYNFDFRKTEKSNYISIELHGITKEEKDERIRFQANVFDIEQYSNCLFMMNISFSDCVKHGITYCIVINCFMLQDTNIIKNDTENIMKFKEKLNDNYIGEYELVENKTLDCHDLKIYV